MNDKELKEKIFEDLLRYATQEASRELAEEMPEIENVEFSARHNLMMKKLINTHRRKERLKSVRVIARRVAAVAAIFVIIAGVSVASVQAWRVRFLNFVMSFNSNNTEIRYEENQTNSDLYTIGDIIIEYIPDGFNLTGSNNADDYISLEFTNGDNYFDICARNINSNTAINLDTENSTASKIKINGMEALLVEKGGEVSLNWRTNNHSITLTGNLSKDEIIKIAENLK